MVTAEMISGWEAPSEGPESGLMIMLKVVFGDVEMALYRGCQALMVGQMYRGTATAMARLTILKVLWCCYFLLVATCKAS